MGEFAGAGAGGLHVLEEFATDNLGAPHRRNPARSGAARSVSGPLAHSVAAERPVDLGSRGVLRQPKAQHPSPASSHREARIRSSRAAITAATALTSAVPNVIPTRRMSPVTAFCGLNVVNTIVTVSTVA